MCENGFVLSSGKIVAMSIYFLSATCLQHTTETRELWFESGCYHLVRWHLRLCLFSPGAWRVILSLTRLRLWAVQRWMTCCQIACAVLSVQECYCCACHWAGIQWLWKVVPRSSCQLCHAAKRNVPRLIIRPLSRAHPPSRWMQEIFSILLYLCSWLKNII